MASAEAALARLCDPGAEVSAHYLIGNDAKLWQLVAEDQRAWHAGAGSWGGTGDVNSRSIGIELDNRGTHPFAEGQMQVLEALLRAIMARWSITPDGVIAHSDMAPERKGDPGPRFDWARLAQQGLARPSGTRPRRPDQAEFLRAAAIRGYPVEGTPEAVLNAVRLRYRPWGRGPLSAQDMAVLAI